VQHVSAAFKATVQGYGSSIIEAVAIPSA